MSAVNRSFWPATFFCALQPALLRLEDKTVLLVEVDTAPGVAVFEMLGDSTFEDVVVVLMGGVGGIGRRQLQQCDQLVEK